MDFVTDTHSLIFYLSEDADELLPKRVAKVFSESEKGKHIINIPIVVLTEIVYLVECKRVKLDIDELLERIKKGSNFRIINFDYNIFKIFLKSSIPGIHDRMIVSTAIHLGAPLITRDGEIERSREVEVIWKTK